MYYFSQGLPIIDDNIQMVKFDEVEPLHAQLVAEVQGPCTSDETDERSVKIREKGYHVDSNAKEYKLRLKNQVRCNERPNPKITGGSARDEL